ncbi:MAG: glycosyltransferase family 39 protein [Streptosporangiales bacterium]|nr:glycosyltransferase family 39 protein [Streptosporangiales bacterium]
MKKNGESGRLWPYAALLVITVGAAVADAWGITSDGLEAFYAAGVRSMAGNWHDFLYGSFDPNGLITLDKLPGPFWAQALSVRAFGLSVWAMILPQVVWSVLAVVVLFFSVRRVAGPVAGLVAAGLFAISPVVITSAHSNLGDPLFVLLAVLMADAALRAIDTGRLRWLLLAALWAGIAFQVKMAEAWLLAGIFALVYLACGPRGLWSRAGRLALAAPVLAVVSLAWMVFVALTPATSRPYADGSTHNSVFEQVFVYNGLIRFGSGAAQLFGLHYLAKPSAASLAYLRRSQVAFTSPVSQSHPSWDRLLTAPVAQLTGWLLLPALAVAVVAVVSAARTRGQERRRGLAPLLAWGLWLLVMAVVFSVSRYVQAYYFAILSPAIAALCALGLARLRGRPLALAAGVSVAALASACVLTEAAPPWRWAGAAAGGVALVAGGAAVALAVLARRAESGPGRAGTMTARVLLMLTAAAGLAGPVIADGWAFARHAGPFDPLLTSAGTFAEPSRASLAARLEYPGYGGTIVPRMTPALWKRLQQDGREQNGQVPPGQKVAVYSSAAASNLVVGGTRRVLPIGGFTGVAPWPTAAQVTKAVVQGKITYALVPGPDDPRGDDPRVRAIRSHCLEDPFAEKVSTRVEQVWFCGKFPPRIRSGR